MCERKINRHGGENYFFKDFLKLINEFKFNFILRLKRRE